MKPTLVFICYPETYAVLALALKKQIEDVGYSPDARQRIIQIVSGWEAALQTEGDSVSRVEVYGNRLVNPVVPVMWAKRCHHAATSWRHHRQLGPA
jgi:hypothetical protein